MYIPTLTAGQQLAACLDALEAQTAPIEVVIADNGPGEGCAEMLETRFPSVKRVSFEGKNLGFGAALNRAVAAEGEGPLVFLNDDAIPEPEFVEELLAGHRESGAAMVAAVLLRASDPDRIDSAGIVCDRSLTAWDYLTGEPASRLAGAGAPFGPTGGGALFAREAFEAIGGFDERIFLYYEDLDLALRMQIAGHGCHLATRAKALHEGSATAGKRAATKYFHTGYSRGYLLRKYGILRDPASAAKALLSDGTAALGQLLLDHTLAGARGKCHGWRDARGISKLDPPLDRLEPTSLRRHMRVRYRRRQP